MRNRFNFPIVIIFVIFIFISACTKSQEEKQSSKSNAKKQPVTVKVAPVVQKTVPLEIKAVGNTEAYATVVVKTQIGGTLVRQAVQDGQFVSKGDLLFEIDPRPFEIALKDANAKLERDKALLEKANSDLSRFRELAKNNVVSKEQNEQSVTNTRVLTATIKQDEAAVERARLDLEYAIVKSPLNGKIGSVLLHAGNVVKANDDRAILTIHQIQPIHVGFSVPERYLPAIYAAIAHGKSEVSAVTEGDDKTILKGELSSTDNAVDKTTGTLRLKARFANADKALMPGQFLRVRLKLSEKTGAIVVPSKAVQSGINGEYVYVLQDAGKDTASDQKDSAGKIAALRWVTVGQVLDGETIIERGVNAGETVVTDGHIQLSPGRPIEIQKGDAG
jgi:membrane fusion protein, multidrug efflux system